MFSVAISRTENRYGGPKGNALATTKDAKFKDARAAKLTREYRVVDLERDRVGLPDNVAAEHERQADFSQRSPQAKRKVGRYAPRNGRQHDEDKRFHL